MKQVPLFPITREIKKGKEPQCSFPFVRTLYQKSNYFRRQLLHRLG